MVILFPETNHLSSVRQTTASPSRLNLMGASSAKPPLALQVGCQGRSHSILHAPSKPHHLVLYCLHVRFPYQTEPLEPGCIS